MASSPKTGRLDALPSWARAGIAFLIGGVLTAVSLVQIVPKGAHSSNPSLGLPGSFGGADGELAPGEPGTEEYVLDEQGNLVRRTVGGEGTSGTAGRAGGKSGAASQASGGGSGPGSSGGVGDLRCAAGANGGSNGQKGVTGNQIKLAATVVKTGVGRAFLSDVEWGMKAVMNRVNRAGGVCGRQLTLKLVNDGWKASDGQDAIRRFIREDYFALAVVPSSEGLRQAGGPDGDIDRAGMPVVGADGMLIHQYTDPWIWAVAASTISTMHIMAQNAYDRGARTFGIVWERSYRFGVEGASAFRGALSRLDRPEDRVYLNADVDIIADQNSYTTDINNRFNNNCGDCDFVALLLEPTTAVTWIRGGGYLGTRGRAVGVGGPQPLFGDNFARSFAANCPYPCYARFWIWTGFKPPIPPFDTDPFVDDYEDDMIDTNSSADRVNQFVEGGYDGMLLLVQALQKVGPKLTRQGLRDVLDGMDFDSGLSTVRSFRPGNHFANIKMQPFSIVLNAGSFAGWRYEGIGPGWVADPWPGQDVPSS